MKIKKIFLILTTVLLLSVFANITANAYLSANISQDKNVSVEPSGYRQDAPKDKAFNDLNGENIKLTYSLTEYITSNEYTDVYLDKNENWYKYDENGNFIGFLSFTDNSSKTDKTKMSITKDEAKEIAIQTAKSMYGDIFDEFEYKEELYLDYKNSYLFTFTKNYGKNNFITGAIFHVEIAEDGAVTTCGTSNLWDYEDFDASIISEITENEISEFVNKRVNETYDCIRHDMTDVYLVKQNGKYVIKALVDVTMGDKLDDGSVQEYTILKDFYYAI